MQRYRADKAGPTYPNGAIPWFAVWMGGPSLARVNACPYHITRPDGSILTGTCAVYIQGEADTAWTVPAAVRIRGCYVRGYLSYPDDGAGPVFRGAGNVPDPKMRIKRRKPRVEPDPYGRPLGRSGQTARQRYAMADRRRRNGGASVHTLPCVPDNYAATHRYSAQANTSVIPHCQGGSDLRDMLRWNGGAGPVAYYRRSVEHIREMRYRCPFPDRIWTSRDLKTP